MNGKSQEIEVVTSDGEVVTGMQTDLGDQEQSLAVSLARTEIDQKIATSRAMPRNIRRAVTNITQLATLNEKSAEQCIYALPRGGKPIKGPSIRLAEIIASQWGNCHTGSRVIHVDRSEKFLEAEGVFFDLESNATTTSRVRRRISDKNGRLLSDDMIIVTGNAACSVAKRNAILAAVPQAVWGAAYDAVEAVLSGNVSTLVERREKAMKMFAAFGVAPDRVCKSLGIESVEEIGLDMMPTLLGCYSALKSGEATVEELFPVQIEKVAGPKDLSSRLAALTEASPPKETRSAQDEAPAPTQEQHSDDPVVVQSATTDAVRALGYAAAKSGMTSKARPIEYSNDSEMSQAWMDGFKEGLQQ